MANSESIDSSKNNEILISYNEHIRKRTIRFIKIGILLGNIIIPFLIIDDIYITNLPREAIVWRLLPVVTAFITLILINTRLRNNAAVIKILFGSLLISLLTMMFGIIMYINIPYIRQTYITGALLNVFLIFAVSTGGYRFVLPVYLVPTSIFILISTIFTFKGNVIESISTLITLILAISILTVFSEIMERMRFNEFSNNIMLLSKNKVIEEKNLKMDSELNLARIIQRKLIPSRLPDITGLQFSMVYHPMEAVGGDFFDFVRFKEKELIGIFISDVSGHGVPAALITSMIKALIDTSDEKKLLPGQLLGYINSKISGLANNSFITAFYAIYNSTNGMLTYARAGHNYPLLIRNNTITELKSAGLCIGLSHGISFQENQIQLKHDDKVLFFTDGLFESRNPEGIEFEEKLINEILFRPDMQTGVDFANNVMHELVEFTRGEQFDDDICIIGIKVL